MLADSNYTSQTHHES